MKHNSIVRALAKVGIQTANFHFANVVATRTIWWVFSGTKIMRWVTVNPEPSAVLAIEVVLRADVSNPIEKEFWDTCRPASIHQAISDLTSMSRTDGHGDYRVDCIVLRHACSAMLKYGANGASDWTDDIRTARKGTELYAICQAFCHEEMPVEAMVDYLIDLAASK